MIKHITLFTFFLCCFWVLNAQVEIQGDLEYITQFNDIDVSPSGNGWAVGTCGTIARTTDGMNWTLMEQPVGVDAFFQVVCADDDCQTVFLMGEENYRSTDGGGSWALLNNEAIFSIQRLPNSTRLMGSGRFF